MYLDHFGLNRPPFKITPDTRVFFPGGSRGEILEAIIYAILSGEGIVKVVGEVGSGKTMLSRMLEIRLPETVDIVYLANPNVASGDIMHAIALEMGLKSDEVMETGPGRLELLHKLQTELLARHADGRQVVCFVEEAQAMPLETLEEIRLLSNLETHQDKLLQIVLFGQPELDENLDLPEIRQLRERIVHSFSLAPFGVEEIREYIRFRMQGAGYRGPDLFTTRAYRRIAAASLGLVRRVNVIGDKALLAAFAANSYQVSTREVTIAVSDSEFGRIKQRPRTRRGAWVSGIVASLVVLAGLGIYLGAFKSEISGLPGWDRIVGIMAPAPAPAPASAPAPAPAWTSVMSVNEDRGAPEPTRSETTTLAPARPSGPTPVGQSDSAKTSLRDDNGAIGQGARSHQMMSRGDRADASSGGVLTGPARAEPARELTSTPAANAQPEPLVRTVEALRAPTTQAPGALAVSPSKLQPSVESSNQPPSSSWLPPRLQSSAKVDRPVSARARAALPAPPAPTVSRAESAPAPAGLTDGFSGPVPGAGAVVLAGSTPDREPGLTTERGSPDRASDRVSSPSAVSPYGFPQAKVSETQTSHASVAPPDTATGVASSATTRAANTGVSAAEASNSNAPASQGVERERANAAVEGVRDQQTPSRTSEPRGRILASHQLVARPAAGPESTRSAGVAPPAGFTSVSPQNNSLIRLHASREANVRAPDGSKRPALLNARISATRDWLSVAAGSHFSIQLMMTRQDNWRNLERFLWRWPEEELGSIYIYETTIGGRTWYGVLFSEYDSLKAAQQALNRLPEELQRHKPYVRRISRIGPVG